MTLALLFPQIDPVIFQIGPFEIGSMQLGPFGIRWYALAYIAGILLGWRWCARLLRKPPQFMTVQAFDDVVLYVTLGIVLGGRLGYVLFYKPDYYLQHPLQALEVWTGGMSFHGGMLGTAIAMVLFARSRKVPLLPLADLIACGVPFGLFFGRVANFINGELWGRVTDMPWGMVFPGGGPQPRHPSQLYQACLEGILLFTLLFVIERAGGRRRPGLIAGMFLIGYGIARSIGELFREPDAFLGFLVGGLTMGQLLSAPMILAGAWLVWRARQQPEFA